MIARDTTTDAGRRGPGEQPDGDQRGPPTACRRGEVRRAERRQPPQQHRPAPESVAERPGDDLAEGQAQQHDSDQRQRQRHRHNRPGVVVRRHGTGEVDRRITNWVASSTWWDSMLSPAASRMAVRSATPPISHRG